MVETGTGRIIGGSPYLKLLNPDVGLKEGQINYGSRFSFSCFLWLSLGRDVAVP